MQNFKPLSMAIAVLILSLSCSPPAGAADEPEPARGDWLVRSLSNEPETLNPILAHDAYETIINGYSGIMESLVDRDPDNPDIYRPVLCATWEESPDHLEYTFHLRDGIKWHDGRPFTVEDLRYSYDVMMATTTMAPFLQLYYRDVESLEVLDEDPVRFTMKKPYFLAFDFLSGFPIVPKHVFDTGEDFNTHPAGRHPVGTGPYRFEKWETGEQIVLVRNPLSWRKDEPIAFLDEFLFRLITDPQASLTALKSGEIDMTGLTPTQWAKQTESETFEESFNKIDFFTPFYSYIGWNMRKPPFDDRRVRLAMTHLVDRERYLQTIFRGLGRITTGTFYIFSPYYSNDIEPWPYDPDRADELLAEAGWEDTDDDGILDKDGNRFSFEMLIRNDSPDTDKLVAGIQEELRFMGIEMSIRKLEWGSFLDRVKNWNYDATVLGWSLGYEQDPYQLWHSSQADMKGSSNASGFKSAEADEIIEAARTEFDREKRIEMYHRFGEILHEEQPYTFLYCTKGLMALDKRFHGIKIYKLRPGYDVLEWYVPKPMQRYTSM
jgi:peptide/nickel transport system substrate-binding protein